jgi:hypothetical protein
MSAGTATAPTGGSQRGTGRSPRQGVECRSPHGCRAAIRLPRPTGHSSPPSRTPTRCSIGRGASARQGVGVEHRREPWPGGGSGRWRSHTPAASSAWTGRSSAAFRVSSRPNRAAPSRHAHDQRLGDRGLEGVGALLRARPVWPSTSGRPRRRRPARKARCNSGRAGCSSSRASPQVR